MPDSQAHACGHGRALSQPRLLRDRLADLPQVAVSAGADALDELVASPDIDTVVAGIVGFAGLRPTLSAARAGKTILLANKEALVSAGALFIEAVKQGATLLPGQ